MESQSAKKYIQGHVYYFTANMLVRCSCLRLLLMNYSLTEINTMLHIQLMWCCIWTGFAAHKIHMVHIPYAICKCDWLKMRFL